MNRRTELAFVTILLLLAAVLRLWSLGDLPPGFATDELASIHMTELVRGGYVAVYYVTPDGTSRAGLYGVVNNVVTGPVGDGLLGYRVLPASSGLLTLALLYALARRLFGVRVALVALAVAVVNLRLILLARSATAETLVIPFVLLALLVLVMAFNLRRTIHFHAPGTMLFAGLAFLAGTAGYLHFTALLIGPLCVLFAAHLILTGQPVSRRVWSSAVFVVVLASIIGLPYLVSTFREVETSEPYLLWSARPQSLRDVVDGVLQTIGGVVWQGDARVTHAVGEAALLGPLLALLMVIGVVEGVRRWRDPRYALLLMVLAGGLLTDVWIDPEPTFSANLFALPAVMIFPAVGALVIARNLHARGTRAAWQPVGMLIALVLVVNVFVVRDRLFNDWRDDPKVHAAYHTQLARVAAYLDRDPDSLPVSFCTARLDMTGASGLTRRETLAAMMHRENLDMRHADCRGGIVLIDAGAPMRFVFGSERDRALMPPELLEWVASGEPVPVDGLADGMVSVLDVQQRLRDLGGVWDALAPAYFMPDDDGAGERVTLPVPFDDRLTFAGYDPRVLERARVAGGDPIVLTTYWRVDGNLPDDLGIFAHLLAYPDSEEDDGAAIPLLEPWAESNAIDVVVSELQPRDFFVQVSYLWLSDNLKPAPYALTVGAYTDTVTVLANHLPVLDVAQDYAPRGDRLVLGNIMVEVSPDPADESAGDSDPAGD